MEGDEIDNAEDRDKLRSAREARSKKYGIGIKDDGHLTPPKGFPDDETLYADPVNYKYPMDTEERAYAAIRYWGKYKSAYTPEEQKIIEERMKKLAKKFGIEPNFSKPIKITDIEMSVVEADSDRPVVLSAPALKPGVWNGVYKFDADAIIESADKWLDVEVLSDHDRTNPLATVGKIFKSEASADGVLTLYFKLNDTTAGRDVATLVREGHKFSVSVGIQGDLSEDDDGGFLVHNIEPDHLALLRFGHQAVDGAHVEVISMSRGDDAMTDEKIEEFQQKISELEQKVQEYEAKIAEYEAKLSAVEKEKVVEKIRSGGFEISEEQVAEMSVDELEKYYYQQVEEKFLAMNDYGDPVKVKGDTPTRNDNPFIEEE